MAPRIAAPPVNPPVAPTPAAKPAVAIVAAKPAPIPASPPPPAVVEARALEVAPAGADEGRAEAVREEVRSLIRVAVEEALASALAWQRDADTRIARAELDLATLRTSERAHAEQAQARSVARAQDPPPAVVAQAAVPVAVRYAAPPVVMSAPLPSRLPLPSVDDVPFDADMLPDALNGARRKRALAWGALLVLLLGLGTLVVSAIASQAKHGL